MEKIPISTDLKSILPSRFAPVSLVDDHGQILGTYVPKLTEDDVKPAEGWPTGAEIEAMASAPGTRHSTAEVIAHLRSLG